MYVANIVIRQWLARWFGTSSVVDQGEHKNNSQALDLQPSDQPMFSLGDTKQDLVVSFRPAETAEND